ncbi:purine-nucleoside phosphorylase [Mycoplasmatota bacterium]|nr:purine-nucleoside phosphorylase [Mycoplasmatota bacterium]
MNYDYEFFKKSADYVLDKIDFKPEIGLILGSACGSVADEIEDQVVIDFESIPNFLKSTVKAMAGTLILGTLNGKKVACMNGRFHYYEGYTFEQLVIPIRLFKLLGVGTTILTNAAGGVNMSYRPGDVMIIKDHLKFMGASPLRGHNVEEFGPRFFDVTQMYTPKLRELAKKCAKDTKLKIHEGNYFYWTGPQFETPAEINAIRILGGDAVGMSTVTESLTAAHCGMDLLAMSLITNVAAGILDQPITTEEVREMGQIASAELKKLVRNIVKEI